MITKQSLIKERVMKYRINLVIYKFLVSDFTNHMKSVSNITIHRNTSDKIKKKDSLTSNGAPSYTSEVVPISKF